MGTAAATEELELGTSIVDEDAMFNHGEDRGDTIEDELNNNDAISKIAGEEGGEGEGENTGEPESGTKPEGEGKTGEPGPVPYSRLAAEVAKRKDLESTIQAMQEKMKKLEKSSESAETGDQDKGVNKDQTAESVDIKALRRKAKEAFLEGDLDKSDAIESQIDEEIQRRAETAAINRINKQQYEKFITGVVSEIEAQYPMLKPEGGSRIAINAVKTTRDEYIEQGLDFAEALRKASEDVAKEFGWKKPDPNTESDDTNKEKEDPRKKAAIERGVKNSESPDNVAHATGSAGNRGTGLRARDITKMSEKEFNSLSEDEKSRLRGDSI